MVDQKHPFPPIRPIHRSILKEVAFNPIVSEVGYKGYKRLFSTIMHKTQEKNHDKKDYEIKSQFCKSNGFYMIEHEDEHTGLYMQRWYNPAYGAGEGYKLQKALKLIKIRKMCLKCATVRKAGFVMQSTAVVREVVVYGEQEEIDSDYKEMWTHPQ